ncbi:MAG: TonB-dependent receptor domain-containing protein [Rhodanobacteraceae bacterium]
MKSDHGECRVRRRTDACETRRNFPLRRNALALALAAALGSTGIGGMLVAVPGHAATPSAEIRTADYHIAPGALGQALDRFAEVSGVQVDYPPQLVAGKNTVGASGRLSSKAALAKLLRGTGITAHRIDGTTFVLTSAPDRRDPPDPVQQTAPPPPSSANPQAKPKPSTLKTITVTGSLIPQAQVETFVPTITLQVQNLENSGFGSVYTALRALPLATGSVHDNQDSATGFTPGAETISLLGLDPGFTLYLVNGHPITSYPLLYNGRSNFVNIGDIPMGMVDRIDIVPGNLSSIYGSGAIAGVVNIILKHHINGYELNVRGGTYTDGGGQNQRVEFIGGLDRGRLSMIYGAELYNQKGVWGQQRNISSLDNPDPTLRYGYPIFMHQYLSPSYYTVYQDPGDECDNKLFYGTLKRESRPNEGPPLDPETTAPTGPGYYCGTPRWWNTQTILNYVRSAAGYLNARYELNDNTELYANILYDVDKNETMDSYEQFWQANYWGSDFGDTGLFWNANTNRYESLWRFFTPEESGSNWRDCCGGDYLEHTYNVWAGARGNVGNINYDAFYARSQDTLDERIPWVLTDKVNQFFQKQVMGPLLGTTSGYPIYAPDIDKFYQPITPAQYASFNGIQRDHNVTWRQSVNLHVSDSNLFKLPGGNAGVAALIQYGEQVWSNPTDPRVIAGDFYNLTGTSGGGRRNFMATAGEFRAPVFKMLTLDLSGRYDRFKNQGGGTDHRLTYKFGIEFRPFQTLLLRGNYSTAFRAPDMAYVFGGKSGNFNSGFTDYYRCDLYGGAVDECPYFNNQGFFEQHFGNRNLKSVTAKSFGYGIVWSPTSNFNAKADYYDVTIHNEVEIQSADALLKTEAQCRTGALDISSAMCVAAISQVERAPATALQPNELKQLTTLPINIANERVAGIVASLAYSHGLGHFGDIDFQAHYNVTLKHTFQEYPGEAPVDLLRQPGLSPFSTEFKTIANASVTWNVAKWSVTLYGVRYGSTPNYAAQYNGYGTDLSGYNGQPAGSIPPWILYNGSVTYHLNPAMRLSVIAHNVRNTMPPTDLSYVGWPYYNSEDYNPYGREVWLEFDWRFGQH